MATVGANSATLFCTNPVKRKYFDPRGLLPLMAYTGRLRPKRLFQASGIIYEKAGITLAEVYERVGKSVISACKKAKK